MGLGIVLTRAQLGMTAPLVRVEVHTAGGLPKLNIVGLPAAAVRESKDRVRSALANSGFEFPRGRITVNLAPADLPKDGGRYDLAIAIGILLASGQLRARSDDVQGYEFISELALDGSLRTTHGVLPAALQCRHAGRRVVTAEANASEAAIAGDDLVLGAELLLCVVAHLNGQTRLSTSPAPPRSNTMCGEGDLSDVRGQWHARRAVEIAAAGAHNLLMVGTPGSGKTMLAHRLPTVLPPLGETQALESAAVRSVSPLGFDSGTFGERPFRAPHHSASAIALIGGGNPPRPGEISLAHHGVLFLDELGEFPRHVLDALRTPVESGEVHISRAARQACFPARVQLIACMNPCPCGFAGDRLVACTCSAATIDRYRARVSGPMLDRFDLLVHVPRVRLDDVDENGEPSAIVAQRVGAANTMQRRRQHCDNAHLSSADLAVYAPLENAAKTLLSNASERLCLSERARQRVHRVARTIADLAGTERLAQCHVAEALSYRVNLMP